MQRFLHWNGYRKILCIRTDNLGDVLMTEPAFRSLKKSRPDRELHLLTSPAGAAAANMIGSIDKVITCSPIWMPGSSLKPPDELLSLAGMLKKENYDGAIIFNVYSQNPLPAAMLCYLSGIPEVGGYCRENPYGLMSAWLPDDEPLFRIRHEVLRQMDLAWHMGGIKANQKIRIELGPELLEHVRNKIDATFGCGPFMLLHPGASEQRRQYPPALFREFALLAANELQCKILVTGSEEEKILANEIAPGSDQNIHSVAGMFNIREFAALISLARVLISNNTGPVHIAAATGTPLVVLYAQTNPQHTPWMVDHILLPFDVPAGKRSQNTLIRFAHGQSFNPVSMVEPQKILKAVETLMAKPNKTDQKINEYT
jgi:ADP-heptose:LPS heptosyltransferase